MCLAIPVQITELRGNNMALVDMAGVEQEISVALLDDVNIGDYVILHVGYALKKIDPEEAQKTLELIEESLAFVVNERPAANVSTTYTES